MKLMMKNALVPLLGLAVIGALAVPGSAKDLTPVSLRLAWVAGGVDAPFFVAKEKGYFAAEGLDVTITDGNGSTGSIQAIGSGGFDFAVAGLGALAQASQASGFSSITAVAGIVQKDPSAILALKGSGIVKPKDIEGKRLGTEAGNYADGMILAFAEANDVDMSKVKVVIINSGEDIALLKGDVDFVNEWANPDGDKIAALHPIEEPILFADHGVNILGSSVIVAKDYSAAHPEIVKGFLAAVRKAAADAAANPKEAADVIVAARPDADTASILSEIEVMKKYQHTAASEGKPFGWVAPEDVATTISLLEKYSEMKPGLKPETIYDGSFLPMSD